jgi:replicative DNA helicase
VGRVISKDDTIQLERTILSAILNYSHAMPLASERLRLHHFTSPANRAIYQACCDLTVAGIKIDYLTVLEQLPERVSPDGNSVYLAELLTAGGTVGSLGHYVSMLIDAYIRWQTLGLTADLIKYESGHEMLAEVERRLTLIESELESNASDDYLFTAEVMEALLSRLRHKPEKDDRLFKSTVPDLDAIIGGFQAGTVTALQALYKTGKTKFLLMVLAQNARLGVPVGLLSLEMSEVRVRDWVLSYLCRIDSRYFRAPHSPEWQYSKGEFIQYIEKRSGELVTLPFYVNDIRRPTIDQVSVLVAQWARKGVKLVGLDYFERMETGGEWKDEGAVTSRLADIAMKNNVALIYIDQLNKTAEQSDKTSLMHARGSVSRCADADTLLQMKNLSSRNRKTEGDTMSEIEMLIVTRDGISGNRIKLRANLSIGLFTGACDDEGR